MSTRARTGVNDRRRRGVHQDVNPTTRDEYWQQFAQTNKRQLVMSYLCGATAQIEKARKFINEIDEFGHAKTALKHIRRSRRLLADIESKVQAEVSTATEGDEEDNDD